MKSPSTIDLMLIAVKVAFSPNLPNAPFSRTTAQRVINELLEAARVAGFKQLDITQSALLGGNPDTTIRLLTAACALVTREAATVALGRAGLTAHRIH